jgi:predicted metal-binding membrane protein
MTSGQASERAFVIVATLLFAASAAATIAWCSSMSAMPEMPMPGGWAMSMTWMPQHGRPWFGAAGSFVGMWVVMTVAMMLPSLMPTLWRYRRTLRNADERRLGRLTAVLGVGYLFVWAVFGMLVFALGVAWAAVAMAQPALARAMPIAAGVVVSIGGTLQFTEWKARHLVGCRDVAGVSGRPGDVSAAWRHGVRLGLHCGCCSAGFTAILLVIGVMNPGAMAVVGLALTIERLVAGDRVPRGIGAVAVAVGLLMIARAVSGA